MSNIVHSVGNMVGAGVKGLMGFAEGYMQYDEDEPESSGSSEHGHPIHSQLPRPIPVTEETVQNSNTARNHSNSASTASSLSTHSSLPQTDNLIQTTDVSSGWIHIPAAYMDDDGGQRTVKSFGLRNLVDSVVQVEVSSDMRDQVSFWISEDDKPADSGVSSASSSSSSPSSSLTTSLRPNASCQINIAFQPYNTSASTSTPSILSDEVGATPRVNPAQVRSRNLEPIISPTPSISAYSRGSAASDTSSQSVVGSLRSGGGLSSNGARRQESIHRAFSVHGLITIKASTLLEVPPDGEVRQTPTPLFSRQTLNLPLFATVCRSLFTAALIDPVTGLVTGQQISSGKLELDFGPDSVVGGEYHRDILLVNRSEVELVWNTAVVNAKNKDAVWFSLRDLDSENVFGVDNSSQPVPLPALSSRHLRLELRVRSPLTEFDFDFLLSNVNQPGNVVTCHAVGSGVAEATENTLKLLSETNIDFGEICDGLWAKKVISCKNTGSKPLDVRFSATPGFDVVFRLGGVAGDDMDEDLPIGGMRPSKKASGSEKRSSSGDVRRGRDLSVSRKSSRGASPSSSIGHDSSSLGDSSSPYLAAQFHADLSNQLSSLEGFGPSPRTSARSTSEKSSTGGGRDLSQPPSRGLSRVTSRTSSYLQHASNETDDDEDAEAPFLSGGDSLSTSPRLVDHSSSSSAPSQLAEGAPDKFMPNQIEELTMRPGTEYRVFLFYRPTRAINGLPKAAGALRETNFRVYLDSTTNARAAAPARRTLKCTAMSCTPLISIASGNKIDYGEVTVGASKVATITILNLSALSARVEIAAISKVLSANRNVIVIPPFESVEERIEFFPRRINDRYEKQMFVRNLLNRANDQLIEIRSKNVDVYNLTIHSHLYRILTPSGSNFLDFGSVVINAPSVRAVYFENLTMAPLALELMASQPEDVELFVKMEDAPPPRLAVSGKYAAEPLNIERVTSPPNGELKERFMETMRELSAKTEVKPVKAKGKAREKSETKEADGEGSSKSSIGASMAAALKKGGRGRPVQLYGNAVVFKDRSLLEHHEYLDLAAGPPVAAHRTSPRSKRTQLLDTIELEDKSKLSGQHPKVPKLDFAAGAKATGLLRKDAKVKKSKLFNVTSPRAVSDTLGATPSMTTVVTAMSRLTTSDGSAKSPALTAKRIEPKTDVSSGSDVSKMTVDELLVAMEQQDSQKATITHTSVEEEEQYVRKSMALRKELQNLITTGKLVPARTLSVQARTTRKLIVVMTPNGSTRPHVSTKPKRADSRVFIKLADFDRALLSAGSSPDLSDLPVRDLVIRSSCVRSVLEVQQTSINFGGCDKGEVKSKMIVIQNKSDCIGMFRLRTSGSIASGDLKLGSGRLGVISAFGRKEVEQFSFIPTLVGNYQETLTVENVLDNYNHQAVSIKAVVRKQPAMIVDQSSLDFGSFNPDQSAKWPESIGFTITNVGKIERTFVVEAKVPNEEQGRWAEVSLVRDEKGGGVALSKGEEEEVETILQKLKIARRKGKADKIKKYETRLSELGVTQPGGGADESDAEGDNLEDGVVSGVGTPLTEVPPGGPLVHPAASTTPTKSITVTLQSNQKIKILVRLVPLAGSDTVESGSQPKLAGSVVVYDRKNTDEVVSVGWSVQRSDGKEQGAEESAEASSVLDEEPLPRALMQHCLQLTLQCPVSQTAFCVGSTLFLPDTSSFFPVLRPFFPVFPPRDPDPVGLLLGDGYSRQIPGNTHAEANALTNLRTKYAELVKSQTTSTADPSPTAPTVKLPPIEDVLKDVDCYATMEPCSVRTSGGPSCALELVRAKVKTVYLGVEEPPDFVQCEGVKILQEGGVVVQRVKGLEEDCLKAARRGRS